MLVIPDNWLERWQDQDIFERLFAIDGHIFREHNSRKTIRFTIDNNHYFVKLHHGVGWKEIIKNIIQLRFPVISAKNEWQAIKRLDQLNINTMRLVGYGKKGCNPARLRSFVLTEELPNTISLEDYCLEWREAPPSSAMKRALITEVAQITRTLHENGLNHRDLYICHFLLDISKGKDDINPCRIRLYLIDLHRMQIRKRTPWRWRVKDIAALYFSSMGIGLTKRDLLRFIRTYRNKPLKQALKQDKLFWWYVRRRGKALYREGVRKNFIL